MPQYRKKVNTFSVQTFSFFGKPAEKLPLSSECRNKKEGQPELSFLCLVTEWKYPD